MVWPVLSYTLQDGIRGAQVWTRLCEQPPVTGFPLKKDASEHVTGVDPIAAPGADAHSASFIAEPVREVPQLDAAGESRGCAEFHQLPMSCYVGTGLG